MAKKKQSASKKPPRAAAAKPVKTTADNVPQGDRTEESSNAPASEAAESPVKTRAGFPIAGIGASAGGLEAFTALLNQLPDASGLNMALVLVQHLSPDHGSLLPDLLARQTRLPVIQATEGIEVEPGKVYVIPPNQQMGIENGSLRLRPRPSDHSGYHPIDHFFRSLAQFAESRAIGVVLSGGDGDGALGLQEIKAAGGIAIVQEPATAKHPSMPNSAIATNVIDLVLSPAGIAEELVRISGHPYIREPRVVPGISDGLVLPEDELQKVFAMLRRATGVDFRNYKLPTIKRRLHRRMLLNKTPLVSDYLDFLIEHPQEIEHLYEDLLIHVTRFFREPSSFESLHDQVLPRLLSNRKGNAPVRCWVPGCSTGEEAYSLGITLLEYLGADAPGVPIQIFGTDLSEAAINHARAAFYPENIGADVSPQRLRRFFKKTDSRYQVSKVVRDLCVFARHDLTRDPPFSRLDLILCRNVLIYLSQGQQKKLMSVFHYALRPTGFLMLGSSETVGSQADLFGVLDKKHRIYSKKLVDFGTPNLLGDDDLETRTANYMRGAAEPPSKVSIHDEANRAILERYAPPGIIVDADMQIVHFRGQTGPYLEPAPGDATLHLFKMARSGLLSGLRSALAEAARVNKTIRRTGMMVTYQGTDRNVNIEVIPLEHGAKKRFLILFEDATSKGADGEPAQSDGKKSRRSKKGTQSSEEARVEHLQRELAASRDYLQSIIHDVEATNEELQSANEEILSANEELQSTNEELDTAKEELQSTNEELNTVNDELHGRNEELSRLNSDLMNLLSSVQIAIVMVSADLRIRRFTPMAEKTLNLMAGDVGRPIGHIKPNVHCPDLEQLISEVIETVSVIEREVQDSQGRWYALRIRPYKDLTNRIDGAVLSLFDIDAAKRHATQVNEVRNFANTIIETIRGPLLVLDGDLRVEKANGAFCRMFQVSPQETVGALIYELGNGQWDVPKLRKLLNQAISQHEDFQGFEVEHEFPGIGRKRMLLNVASLEQSEGKPPRVLLAIEDATS